MRPIETVWHGHRFRSRLEARWAVLFECLCIPWEYEPQGFELDDGVTYLPDFLLHGMHGRSGDHLYVEVKGHMTEADLMKVRLFSKYESLYLVTDIPYGRRFRMDDNLSRRHWAWVDDMRDVCYGWPYPYSFEYVDGDMFGAFLGVDRNGRPELFGDDGYYLRDACDTACALAYFTASMCRFDHGEQPEDLPQFGLAKAIVSSASTHPFIPMQ